VPVETFITPSVKNACNEPISIGFRITHRLMAILARKNQRRRCGWFRHVFDSLHSRKLRILQRVPIVLRGSASPLPNPGVAKRLLESIARAYTALKLAETVSVVFEDLRAARWTATYQRR
jgi:hypothetical protein